MTYGSVTLLLLGWGLMAVVMVGLYAYQKNHANAGIVDVGWAAGVGFLAILYAMFSDGFPLRRAALGAVAGIWGFRLAAYLFLDRVLPGQEDGRYRMLREQWGERAQVNFFLFFQVQAFWAVLFSVPFLVVAANPHAAWSWWDTAALLVWLGAVTGETVADRQLERFRNDPVNRGKTCRAGLWRYSRHPNYFFEWIHWFTYVLLGVGSPYFWVTLTGPVLMLLFLYKVTGIPYTEKQAMKSRGDDYRRYQETTSAFIPWFPAKGKH